MNVSRHAEDRARERIGWSYITFQEWVATTHSGWIRMGTDYFRAHGVKLSGAEHNQNLYRCPLSETRALCLVVADRTLVTLYPFDLLPGEGIMVRPPPTKAAPKPKASNPAKHTPRAERLQKTKTTHKELQGVCNRLQPLVGQAAHLLKQLKEQVEALEKDLE